MFYASIRAGVIGDTHKCLLMKEYLEKIKQKYKTNPYPLDGTHKKEVNLFVIRANEFPPLSSGRDSNLPLK
jgi:hypothetical protein